MSGDTKVFVCHGPRNWFLQQLSGNDQMSFMQLITAQDDERRQHTMRHVGIPGGDTDEEMDSPDAKIERPSEVAVFSSDFASLQEHVLSNFANLVHEIRPEKLFLQNPPRQIENQLTAVFGSRVEIREHAYPTFNREMLKQIKQQFVANIVGQDQVLERLLGAVYPLTSEATSQKPVVVMLCGPSGVGKTETARFINRFLGGTLLRKQFSMFHTEKFASYLFGGLHSESSFAHDLLDRESGVILLDEFDKANPMFHSAFYQLFDEGRFEDKNYIVDLSASLIICTSNYSSDDDVRQALGEPLHSRFDSIIEFQRLPEQAVLTIIDRTLDRAYSALSDDEKYHIDLEQMRTKLHPKAEFLVNARLITKLVSEMINITLVRETL